MLTIGDPRYLHAQKTVDGNVEDPGIFEVAVYRNLDSVLVPVSAGRFSVRLSLVEGENRIWAAGTNPSGQRQTTDTISIEYWVDHAPKPVISQSPDRQNIVLTVTGNDPDGDAVRIAWGPAKSGSVSMDPVARDSTATFYGPMAPGEYKVTATATDPSGLTGWAAALFTVLPDNSVRAMDMRSNPGWVRDAVVYEIFLPSFTTEGTLRAAQERLEHVRSLGTTVVWLMPVYPNGEAINELNAGYNVTDFYDIHPQLGTLEDFWAFVDEAHRLGLRVILDTTPNHVSENHPWVKETALYGEYANARPIIEKRVLGDNRGMGQSPVVNQGDTVYVHYDGWRLANLNYESPETRFEMLGMYRWWVEDCGADGFRMDVYWGPRNRYGTPAWWRPFRSEIKRTNPDVFILGETDGTGPGTEADYADSGGACDAAYDWNFFNRVRETLRGGAVDELDLRVRNFTPDLEYNHFTGPNAHYFRFLENHDETRIAGSFTQAQARAGSALLLLAPGIPMLYAGQEAGETSRRGRVMWDRAGAAEMENWYTNLLAIRNGFDCFRSASIQRIQAEPQRVYAFLRPDTGLCSAAAVNFSDRAVTARLAIDPALIRVHGGGLEDGKTYYASDVLNDTVYSVTAAGLGSFRVKLAAYGAAALVVSDVPVSRPDVKPPPGPADGSGCILFQNHPNPFRERTEIVYWISNESMDTVSLAVYDVLGNMVRVIVEEKKPSGEYTAQWDGKDGRGGLAASGVYVCRLTVGGKGCAKKMAMVR
jgi:glycosidase